MASRTGSQLIVKAFQKSGILTKQEQPEDDEMNDALDALNDMVESWANDSLLVPALTWENFPLNSGIALYTIGVNGDFNTVRPLDIRSAVVTLGTVDYPVSVISDELFNTQIAVKSAPGLPRWLNFDNAFPLANIRLWSVPTAGLTLKLQTEKQLASFTLTGQVNLAPGWNRCLIHNLAIELCGDYGQEPPASVVQIAAESKSLITKNVVKNHSLDAYPQKTMSNNIYSGWNR